MPRTFKAILFDLDNTILAYDIAGETTWKELASNFARRIDGLASDILLSAIHEARDEFWDDSDRDRWGRRDLWSARREIVSLAFSRLGVDALTVAHELADMFTATRDIALKPFPGAIETLGHLVGSGIRLALITQGQADFQRPKIERFGLNSLFESILVEDEFGVGKPDKRVFLHSLEKLGAEPKDAWMVGDSLINDVEGAQKVGMTGIWVDWRGNGLLESTSVQPDRIITTISELVESA